MTDTTAPAGTPAPTPGGLERAAILLGVGQVALFVGLLVLGVVRASGTGWAVPVLAVAEMGVLGVGAAIHRRPGLRAAWSVALLVGWLGLLWFSPEFLWLGFPVWMILAQSLPLGWAIAATGASLVGVLAVLYERGEVTSASVIGPIVGAAVALGLARGVLMLRREGAAQRDLLARVLAAQEELVSLNDDVVRAQREAGVLAERTRLARDIHDTLAQGFSSILLLARAAERDPQRASALVSEIEATAADNLTEARRVVYALTPGDLVGAGLAEPLRRLGSDLARHTDADVTVDIADDLPPLPPEIEVALLRAAQGALANVRRHARASRVHVTLEASDGMIHLDVVDDGRGFDPAQVDAPSLAGGYGLTALRQRLAELGGGLAIESEPGGGTAVSAHLPLTRGGA